MINTAGGVVGGDLIGVKVALDEGSAVVFTTAAAEKTYRAQSPGIASSVSAEMILSSGSRLIWLPQETILFDGVRLRRDFAVDLAESAELVAAEILVFGRQAYGERFINGSLRDSWRIRRENRLVFADETRVDGAIGDALARGAVAGGARAVALLLFASPRSQAYLEPVRAALASVVAAGGSNDEGGVSLNDGIIVARLLAASAERLRSILASMLVALDVTVPGLWR